MKQLLSTLLCFLIIFSCKKEDGKELQENTPITPADFRAIAEGTYIGTKNNYSWIMGSPPIVSDTTYPWTFTIVRDTSDSSLIADNYLFKVDANLHCYEVMTPGPVIRSFDFRNDSAIIYFRSGGLGGYGTVTIIGVKQ